MSRGVSVDKRLIDYYFVVTASDRAKSGTNQRLTSESLAPRGAKKAVHATFAWKPKIVDRYPATDHPDTPLRPWVARSSLPRGVRARTRPPAPRFTTFVGWNVDGSKLYGAVIEVYEKLKIRNQNEKVYMPKALGFLSHYPYFYAFDVFLRCLWHSIPKEIIRLEDLLVHYFYDIPVPAPGKKIAYDLGKLKVLLTQRNEYDIPIPELSSDILFSRLSEDRICWILRALLLGHRVIFVASQEGELTIVNETFSSLLFPLRWCYLYVPIASKHIALALSHFDGPFMVGLPLFLYKRHEVKSRLPPDALIVEMDQNRILAPAVDGERHVMTGPPSPDLPSTILPELKKGIHALARILTMPVDEGDRPNRNQILAALRVCFNVVRYTISNCAAFLDDRRGDTEYSPDDCEFFRQFGETEMYAKFVSYYHRVHPEDLEFRKIYQFFKSHEALGKDFARPASNSMNTTFNRQSYNSKNFTVDRNLIAKLENQYAARRRTHSTASLSSRTHGSSSVLIPREFTPDENVMMFLRQNMWMSVPTGNPSINKTKSEMTDGDNGRTSASVNVFVSPTDTDDPHGRISFDGVAENGERKQKDFPDEGNGMENGGVPPLTRKSSEGSVYDDGDGTENMVVDMDEFARANSHAQYYDSMSDWSLSEESGADIDDIEAWETESVLSDVDIARGERRGVSSSATHRTRASNTSIRSIQRFRQLNEFELSQEEYRNFRQCEREHNVCVQNVAMLQNGSFVATLIGSDLFTREIMEAWASHDRNLRKTRSERFGASATSSSSLLERGLSDRAGSVSPRSVGSARSAS